MDTRTVADETHTVDDKLFSSGLRAAWLGSRFSAAVLLRASNDQVSRRSRNISLWSIDKDSTFKITLDSRHGLIVAQLRSAEDSVPYVEAPNNSRQQLSAHTRWKQSVSLFSPPKVIFLSCFKSKIALARHTITNEVIFHSTTTDTSISRKL